MERSNASAGEGIERVFPGLRSFFNRLISPVSRPVLPEDLRQTRLLGAMLLLAGLLTIGYQALAGSMFADFVKPLSPTIFIGYLAAAAIFWANRRGRLRYSAWAAVTVMALTIFTIAFEPHAPHGAIYFLDYLFVPLVVAGILLPAWSLGALTVAFLLGMGLAAWISPDVQFETLLMGPGFFTVVAAGVMALYNRQRSLLERDRQRDLASRERRYRALFEGANDGIFLVDQNKHIRTVNRKGAELLGWDLDELLALGTADILAPGCREEAYRRRQALLAGQNPGVFETCFLRKDGSTFAAEVTPALVHDPDGEDVIAQYIVRDITERKASEARLQQQVKRLNALRRIDRVVASGQPLAVMLETLLSETSEQLQTYAAAVLTIDPASGGLAPTAAHGLAAADEAALAAALAVPPPAWQDGDGRAVRLKDGSFAAPLSIKDALKGALWAAYPTAPAGACPDERDWVEFLETLAGQAAIAVDSAEMRLGLERSHAELLASYEATLEGWARALELRDNETQGHSRRVTSLAVSLATALGMSEAELVHFRRGALLHDIGKMGVPDAILFKPGPLTHQEWEVMHMHPVHGRDMLAQVPFLAQALDIPYAHHERWDGSGYPRGLRGKEIPWPARIFAVADAWDALTNDRPYRKAWSTADAWKFLKDQAGSLFDPEVTAALGRFMELESGG